MNYQNMLPYIIDITPAQAKAISDSSISGISIIDVRVGIAVMALPLIFWVM